MSRRPLEERQEIRYIKEIVPILQTLPFRNGQNADSESSKTSNPRASARR
jgi:hypothetical protein